MNDKPLLKVQVGPQEQFANMTDQVPLIFYGGSAGGGKSFSLLFDALKYIDDPEFYGVFFRKTVKQLERTLWKEAKKMYAPYLYIKDGPRKGKFKGLSTIREQDKVIKFPSGATIEFSYLDRDSDCETNWQGAELTAAYFDEFTHFSEFVFNYVRTRMRSGSKYKSFIRCGLNPHATHFVHKYLDIFIDQKTGFAIKEYAGKMAYVVFDKGVMTTSFDLEELQAKFPNKKPSSYTFCPSSLAENKIMLELNESYADDLEANDPANAAMLLHGNWKYMISPNGVWGREVLQGHTVDHLPLGCNMVRAYDKASSKPAKEGGDSKQLDPDYTASIGMARCPKTDDIYVFGNYKEDKDEQQRARFREGTGVRDQYIMEQAIHDGDDVTIILPRDLGQGGVFEYKESSKVLAMAGFTVKQDPSVSNASKLKRFEPFVAACHNGHIKWVRSSFQTDVWDYMILELENFNPLAKNNGFHDDVVDSFSSAYCSIISKKVIRPYSMPSLAHATTKLKTYRDQIR